MEVVYCSIDGFAVRLGVHRNTVKKWLKLGLPALKVGRVWRIQIALADEWLHVGVPDKAPDKPKAGAQRTAPATRARRTVPAFSPNHSNG